ncbi:hypothetical protein G9A89_010389 [Geosiphon pyriformis]|nr:hypothetical protein G9A89_010389 [Geosiphon pyriformis]
MPSNLTTPAENLKAKPETDMITESSSGINPFFSMQAQCLVQTDQTFFLKAAPREHTNLTISLPATLGLQKMETRVLSRNPRENPTIDTEQIRPSYKRTHDLTPLHYHNTNTTH